MSINPDTLTFSTSVGNYRVPIIIIIISKIL